MNNGPIAAAKAALEADRATGDAAIWITRLSDAGIMARPQILEAEGPRGRPLWGLTVAIKDNIDVAGVPTTAAEGAALHMARLRARPADFDPEVRDRLIAGAMMPTPMLIQAQKFRRWYRDAMLQLFEDVDAIIAPITPCAAPSLGQKTFTLDGVELPVRPNLGIFTQPISFIGLPVVAVPVAGVGSMPVGAQIIAPPWREDIAARIGRYLEVNGTAAARRPVEA